MHPGTSLGGARPKASVIDEDGSLTVAKFPSRKDDYDVAQWEHFCHVMGRKAGLNVAETLEQSTAKIITFFSQSVSTVNSEAKYTFRFRINITRADRRRQRINRLWLH